MQTMNDDGVRAGLVGLGRMGGGIAGRLAAAGRLGGVWDIDPTRARVVADRHRVAAADSAGLIRAGCEVLLFAVPTSADVEAALSGIDAPGLTVVDLSTADPGHSRSLAQDLARRGIAYFDAPMSGGAAGAEAGTLSLMVGGAPEELARLRPILLAFAGRITHLGPAGSGHAMKLVHNAVLHATFLATCEGLRVAARAGIAPERAVEVLNAGNARSYVSEVRFPRDILSGTLNAQSAVATLAKDLRLARAFSAQSGASAPFTALTSRLLDQAAARAPAERDFALLFGEYEEIVREAFE
jgi:3-hydroxyisobutyrate dehydrogenase